MTIQIIIGKPYIHYRNTFVAECEFMIGDADGEEYMDIELKTTEEVLEFIELTNRLRNDRDPWYRLGENRRNQEAEEIRKEVFANPIFERYFGYRGEEWPREPYNYHPTALRYIHYFWYNEAGQKHIVTIKEIK